MSAMILEIFYSYESSLLNIYGYFLLNHYYLKC